MATRQYIGARYVVKIYENSQTAGSAEWEANTSYEPLTMVTYQNSSYLSKKAVPSTVGNPASNTDYWVVTGAYNGQIASLQSQINDANASITSLTNEVNLLQGELVVTVSDSYGTVTTPNWGHYMFEYLGVPASNRINLAVSGAGFYNGRFLELIQPDATPNSISSDVDLTKVTAIVVAGGFNDRNQDASNGINNFMQYVNANYPNAKVYIAFVGWSFNTYYISSFLGNKGLRSYANCAKYGATYLNGTENIMKNRGLFVAETPAPELSEEYSYVHPNAEGSIAIGRGIANAIVGGSCTTLYPYATASYKAPDNETTLFGLLNQEIKDGKCMILTSDFRVVNNDTPFTITTRNTAIKIAVADSGTGYVCTPQARDIPVTVRIIGGTTVTEEIGTAYLRFQGSDLYVVVPFGSQGAGQTFTNILFYNTVQVIDIF